MSLVVREEGSIPIPEGLAREFGIRKGSAVGWERTPDGRLTVRAASERQAAIDRFCGMLAHTLGPGESAVADRIREREEDAIREERA